MELSPGASDFSSIIPVRVNEPFHDVHQLSKSSAIVEVYLDHLDLLVVVDQGLSMLADVRLALLRLTGGDKVLTNIAMNASTLLARFVVDSSTLLSFSSCSLTSLSLLRIAESMALKWRGAGAPSLCRGLTLPTARSLMGMKKLGL